MFEGTLVLKNLYNLSLKNVIAVYKSDTPFVYARDGYSEGIKQESAAIADEILSGAWAEHTPTLLNYSNTAEVNKAVAAADWIIPAIGFDAPEINYKEGESQKRLLHDGIMFKNATDIYGFGIAFPSLYEGPDGNKYKDIGFGGFISAIQAALPSILEPFV